MTGAESPITIFSAGTLNLLRGGGDWRRDLHGDDGVLFAFGGGYGPKQNALKPLKTHNSMPNVQKFGAFVQIHQRIVPSIVIIGTLISWKVPTKERDDTLIEHIVPVTGHHMPCSDHVKNLSLRHEC